MEAAGSGTGTGTGAGAGAGASWKLGGESPSGTTGISSPDGDGPAGLGDAGTVRRTRTTPPGSRAANRRSSGTQDAAASAAAAAADRPAAMVVPEPLISNCSACNAPGATAAMVRCGRCRAAPYCSGACLESHRTDHADRCLALRSEGQIRGALERHLAPLCRVLPRGAAGEGGASAGEGGGRRTGERPQRQQRPQQVQVPPSLVPPINAQCHLCHGDATTLDANGYRLMPTGCRRCAGDPARGGYVHPTCLARQVRRQARRDMEAHAASAAAGGNADNPTPTNDDEADADRTSGDNKAEKMVVGAATATATPPRVDYRFMNAYSNCPRCQSPYVGFLANALSDLALADAAAHCQRGDVLWAIARTQHATNLLRAGAMLVDRHRRNRNLDDRTGAWASAGAAQQHTKKEDAMGGGDDGGENAQKNADGDHQEEEEEGGGTNDGTAPDGILVPPEVVRAGRLFQEVVDVLGSEADGTDLDEYRIVALLRLGSVRRFHGRYESAIDLVEQCMDAVATTTAGREGFAAQYRFLAARDLTDLHRLRQKQKGKFIEVPDRGGEEDQSQISDLSDRFRNDDGASHRDRDANADEEGSLHPNRAVVAVVTVDEELHRQNVEDGNGDDGSSADGEEDDGDIDDGGNVVDAKDDDDGDDVPMDEVVIASNGANVSKTDEHIREYEEARGREPEGSEAYMHLTLTIAELLAVDGKYAEALAQLDVVRDLSFRAFGADHALSRAIVIHRNKLQTAQHWDWVPDLPSLEVLVDQVRATQEEYGVDSIESFRMQIYLVAKHVQSSQVALGIQMVCALCNRAATVFDDNHELNQGHNGILADIRDRLASGSHPWLERATDTFTGVTIAGSGRSAMVIKDVVKFEWSETDTLMTIVLPMWRGTKDGLTVTFEEEKIVCGGSENASLNLLGRIDIESSSWRIDQGVQISCIPGNSALIFDLVKATPGMMWKLPWRVNIPDCLFNALMGNDDEQGESDSNDDDEEEEELAAVN